MSGFSDQRGLWGRQNRKGEKNRLVAKKEFTPQRRRLRVIMDEGAQNGERKGRGFFRHQVRSRDFFFFFLICIFFFLFRFCCYLWNQAVGLVYLSVCFVPVEIHESFFFWPPLDPLTPPSARQRKWLQTVYTWKKEKANLPLFKKKKKKKTSLLNLSISVVCLYQYPFFFFCLLFGLHSSAFCASSILSCFIKGVLARTRKPRLLSAPAHRLSHCRYQDVIQDCRAKKKTNQKKNKKKKELQSYFCEA